MTDVTCAFDGCTRPGRAMKYCWAHYRQQKAGKELRPLFETFCPPNATLEERLARYTRKTASCWEWSGSHDRYGYARMRWNDTGMAVYRVIWEDKHGPVPAGMHIDHLCRNKGCVNPAHIQLATPKQNGENVGMSKANTSGARGVTWSKQHQKWKAQVMHNRRHYHAGLFDTVEEAAAAAIAKRNELFTNNLADAVHS